MDAFERQARAIAIRALRDTGAAPSAAAIGDLLRVDASCVLAALRALEAAHRLVLVPGTDAVMMVHPFSGIASDFRVTVGARTWFANCVWDGLAILALLGDGTLETHSPATGDPIALTAHQGVVEGDAVVHFPVPARRFWDDIVFT